MFLCVCLYVSKRGRGLSWLGKLFLNSCFEQSSQYREITGAPLLFNFQENAIGYIRSSAWTQRRWVVFSKICSWKVWINNCNNLFCWGWLKLFRCNQLLFTFILYWNGHKWNKNLCWSCIWQRLNLPNSAVSWKAIFWKIHCHMRAITIPNVAHWLFLPTYVPTRLCSSTAGSSPPRRIAISVYAVPHVSMLNPSAVPGRLAISYVAFL